MGSDLSGGFVSAETRLAFIHQCLLVRLACVTVAIHLPQRDFGNRFLVREWCVTCERSQYPVNARSTVVQKYSSTVVQQYSSTQAITCERSLCIGIV